MTAPTVKSHALFGAAPTRKPAPPPAPKTPRCIFCKGMKPTKVYMEGGIVKSGAFVFKFKGVTHHDCADVAMDEHR